MKNRSEEEVELINEYLHVDNGGLTLSVNRHSGKIGWFHYLEVSDGYYGYSDHILRFYNVNPKQLRALSKMLEKAAALVEEDTLTQEKKYK